MVSTSGKTASTVPLGPGFDSRLLHDQHNGAGRRWRTEMDIRCGKCGEPWDIYTLTDEQVTMETFRAEGCEAFGTSHNQTPLPAGSMALINEMTELLGDDVDGLASELDDMAYLGVL